MSTGPSLPALLTETIPEHPDYADVESLRAHTTWESLAEALSGDAWDVFPLPTDDAFTAMLPALLLARETSKGVLDEECLRRFVPDPRIPEQSPKAMRESFAGLSDESRDAIRGWLDAIAQGDSYAPNRALAEYGIQFWRRPEKSPSR